MKAYTEQIVRVKHTMIGTRIAHAKQSQVTAVDCKHSMVLHTIL